MPRRREEVECRAEREMALTRAVCAWALVLAILFWATSSSPEDWPVRFSIQWSFGADTASTQVAGEGVHAAEMVHISRAMGQDLNATSGTVRMNGIPRSLLSGVRWLVALGRENPDRDASPARFELVASLVRQGRTRVAMRMMIASAEMRD